MELKLNREEICASEVILRTKQEQAIELDYVLPDYYPEIFKIQKCFTIPRISSYSVADNRLSYEIAVSVKVLYCSENSSEIQVIEQKLVFSKTAELEKNCENPEICIVPSVDYINCRAVNQRRLDIRGAVSTDITVTGLCSSEAISDAFGMDIELKKIPITYPVNRLFSSKQISVNEEFELGISKPEIRSIICSDAAVTSTDKKVIANKMVAKGEISVNMIYTCSGGEIETMEFSMPFSQIIDIEGIDERFDCHVDADILSCDISPRSDGDGNTKIAECNMSIMIKCSACRMAAAAIADDEFSISFESSSVKSRIKVDYIPEWICTPVSAKTSIRASEGVIDCVYGVRTGVKSCSYALDKETKQLVAAGTAVYTLIACDEDKNPIFIDKEENFTFNIPVENASDDCIFNIKVLPISHSYNIMSDGVVDIRSEFKICGNICCSENIECLTDIFVDETAERQRESDCALKLYFANAGENVWDIAKHYHSPVQSVFDENDLENETLNDSCMLIIPII